MISDTTKLSVVLGILSLMGLILNFYLWYIVLNQIHATQFMWFVWIFSSLFTLIVTTIRVSTENYNQRLKNLEDRLNRIEKRQWDNLK